MEGGVLDPIFPPRNLGEGRFVFYDRIKPSISLSAQLVASS